MSIFDDASAVIFADANMAVAAVFRSDSDGLPVACRAIPVSPNREFGQVRAGSVAASVSVAAIAPANPKRGDTLAYGASVYRVEDAERDDMGMMWTLTLSIIA